MNDDSLAPKRRELAWVRAQLAERLQRIGEDAAHRRQPLSADAADRAQERENDEVLDGLDAATAALLAQYERAIERLDAGHYGTCERCGFAIEDDRLHALPQATTCASCAAAAPRRKGAGVD